MGQRGKKPQTVLQREASKQELMQCGKCNQTHARPKAVGSDIMKPTCKAHRHDGRPCKTWPVAGLTVCRMHGGAGKHVQKKAAKARAEAEAARTLRVMGEPVMVNPVEALIQLIYASAGHVQWLRGKVEEVAREEDEKLVWGQTEYKDKTGGDDWGTTTTEKAAVNAWLQLYNQERDRLADYCAKAIKAGIEERRVRIAESQGKLVALAINNILMDLNLTKAQMERVPAVVPRRLRELEEA